MDIKQPMKQIEKKVTTKIKMRLAELAYDTFLWLSGVTNSEFKDYIIDGYKESKKVNKWLDKQK